MGPTGKDVIIAGGGMSNVLVNEVLYFQGARRNVFNDQVTIAKTTHGIDAAMKALELYVSVLPQPPSTA